MTRFAIAAMMAAALFTAPAIAEQVTVDAPIQAGSLHDGDLDMVVYYTKTETGAMEVTATFAGRTGPYSPMRIVMAMQDGDQVSFAMPDYPNSQYAFSRAGEELTVSVDVNTTDIAQR